MEAVQSLPKEARVMTANSIMRHVSSLIHVRKLAKEGRDSLEKNGTIPADIVMQELKEKHGL